ncbi:Thiamine biosynthesis lipoprotein ApbE precursor [Novipirellula aureliae]|uniref:FAD:protein FMN transferase n=1 Tax=Novipirellula aureliae TaxID=2527966 RepID=A0A5C6E9F1_9BACT|nr:DUF2271 domain-containing protein [Novipirellula aureliae]TWU43799.1 Thiamine biosynthesis lipoprotein ApbE precursor [Novipirellula aureliae]
MKHSSSQRLRILCFIGLFSIYSIGVFAGEFVYFHENVLGSSLELRLNADNQSHAEAAQLATLEEIGRLSEIYSHYSSSSELSKLSALPYEAEMVVSSELAMTLQVCEDWVQISKGAFNPAAESLSRVWREAEVAQRCPTPEELSEKARAVSADHWRVDPKSNRVTRLSREPLTLNAIAKGTILDGVCKHVLDNNKQITGIAVNIGGDIRVAGDMSQIILIADPKADAIGAKPLSRLNLHNQAVATSGPSERHFTIEGVNYSHLIDPRCGQPTQTIMSATVIAADAETADVLATICSVLPMADSLALVQSLHNVECLLVTAAGVMTHSTNWPGEVPAEDGSTVDAPTTTDHELVVEIEIANSNNSRRYRRPYVAVWIEDNKGFPVKTMGLFLMAKNPGPRWHRDLRRWYAGDQARRRVEDTALIGVISKPTRNPGNYKFSWDGKDKDGKSIEPGKYVLYIEAAREHGTYQLMKHPFEFGDKPFEAELPGNVEIKSASVKFNSK